MKVLVTGGTGYLGRAVVSALAARGHDLVIFARSASRSGLPGTLIDGDIRDRAAVERAASGCDASITRPTESRISVKNPIFPLNSGSKRSLILVSSRPVTFEL